LTQHDGWLNWGFEANLIILMKSSCIPSGSDASSYFFYSGQSPPLAQSPNATGWWSQVAKPRPAHRTLDICEAVK
jgi:hypothetical protein